MPTATSSTRTALFRADLIRTIQEAIAQLPSDTVGIGADNLWMLTASRIKSPHAPVGTNATYYIRQTFNEIVAAKPFNKFVY